MNPFKKNLTILPNASINSVYIDDVLAGDLFRPSLIVEEIKMNQGNLGISNYSSDTECGIAFPE